MRSSVARNNKYWISKHRFLELYHYCLQYNEWKDEYLSLDGQRAVTYDGQPHGTGTGDPVFELARKRAELKDMIETVERTAAEADPAIGSYVLKAVTNENITFDYLKVKMGMPCERDMYYDRRRRFYWLLDRKLKK